MPCNSILRIGGSDESTVDLLFNALHSHFTTNNKGAYDVSSSNVCITNSKDSENKDDCLLSTLQIHMSNKYFSAGVSLQRLDETTNTTNTNNDGNVNYTIKEDGILIVFPFLSTTNLDTLTSIHNDALAKDQCGDLLRLCIGVTFDLKQDTTSKAYEEQYSQRVLWCLDRGYEYIEADLSDTQRGHDDREKEGFARIVEAVCSTVWSSAVMHPKKQAEKQVRNDDQSKSTDKSSEESEKRNQNSSNILIDNSVTNSGINNSEENRNSIEQKEDRNNTEQKEDSHTREEELENNTVSKKSLQNDQEENHNEELLDELEKLMRKAGSIRDASKRGDLSDEQRRERAGNTAELLMGLLGRAGFDDDSDEDEVCDSSSIEDTS